MRELREPKHYEPKERIVYDPEMKRLLEKIEKQLRNEFGELNAEKADLENLDVEELTKILEKQADPKILEKLLEKELVEINETEPKPKLYELEKANANRDKQKSVELTVRYEVERTTHTSRNGKIECILHCRSKWIAVVEACAYNSLWNLPVEPPLANLLFSKSTHCLEVSELSLQLSYCLLQGM